MCTGPDGVLYPARSPHRPETALRDKMTSPENRWERRERLHGGVSSRAFKAGRERPTLSTGRRFRLLTEIARSMTVRPWPGGPITPCESARTCWRFRRAWASRAYDALHRFSVEQREAFWARVLKRLGIVFDKRPAKILDVTEGVKHPRWLVGAQLNITQSCFAGPPDKTAIVFGREDGTLDRLSYERLREGRRSVCRRASGPWILARRWRGRVHAHDAGVRDRVPGDDPSGMPCRVGRGQLLGPGAPQPRRDCRGPSGRHAFCLSTGESRDRALPEGARGGGEVRQSSRCDRRRSEAVGGRGRRLGGFCGRRRRLRRTVRGRPLSRGPTCSSRRGPLEHPRPYPGHSSRR